MQRRDTEDFSTFRFQRRVKSQCLLLLYFQILHVLSVRLDKPLAGSNGVAHEHVDCFVGYPSVLNRHLEQGPRPGGPG